MVWREIEDGTPRWRAKRCIRVNAGFAKLQMNTSLGLDDSMFGLGAGLFFIAYFLLGVPSNLVLDRVGARRWIACIMITWGAISACFAFLQPIGHAIGLSNEYTFYLFRSLLGMAEAGFFPGVVLFLTLWFPALYRARIIGLFTLAAPFSSMLGAPLSGALASLRRLRQWSTSHGLKEATAHTSFGLVGKACDPSLLFCDSLLRDAAFHEPQSRSSTR